MASFNNPENIQVALAERQYPTILMWNRLEGRPRTHNFDKALKAEVRDALWMLTKQWQMGEFKGDDAGSPVSSKLKISTARVDSFKAANGSYEPMNYSMPLEAQVEQKLIPFKRQEVKVSLDIRLQLGKYWHKLLKNLSLGEYISAYMEKYPFELPAKSRDTAYLYANKAELQQWRAIAGRCTDGYELLQFLKDGNMASNGISVNNPAHESILNDTGNKLIAWFDKNFEQPLADESAWLPDRLEYKFSLSAKTAEEDIELTSEEYYHGHLDWFASNQKTKNGTGTDHKKTFVESFIPTHVEFDGMPNTRWWKFEDYKTSFGDIKPSTTDLSKLLLIEFGLVFANDWFVVPFRLPIGSIAEIEGLSITNNFNDTYWIDSVEQPGDTNFDWSMFRQKSQGINKKLFLCPSAMKVQESELLEEVYLLRDEMANMVWGVEKTIPSVLGKGTNGGEHALRVRKFHEEMIGNGTLADVPYNADIYYNAMTSVPENWIPFVPVHASGHKRNVQLQRASMPRIIEGDNLQPEKIKPYTSILREGLDTSTPHSYLLHEEEVPRGGARIQQTFQRTRWLNGEVFVWLGMRKKMGSGEGSSGLAFDTIENAEK